MEQQLIIKSSLSSERRNQDPFYLPQINQKQNVSQNNQKGKNNIKVENSYQVLKEINQVDIRFTGISSQNDMSTRINSQYDSNFQRQQSQRIKRQMSLAARSGQNQVVNNLQILNMNKPKMNSLHQEQQANQQEQFSQIPNLIQNSQQSQRCLQERKNIVNLNNQMQYRSINKNNDQNNESIYALDQQKQKLEKIQKPKTKEGIFLPPAVSSYSQKPSQKYQNMKTINDQKNQKMNPLQISGSNIQSSYQNGSEIQNQNLIQSVDKADAFSAYNILSTQNSGQFQQNKNQQNHQKNLSNSQNFDRQFQYNYNQKNINDKLSNQSVNKQQMNQTQKDLIPLRTRQYESYLHKKETIDQQRLKKQELLKQLDMGLQYRDIVNTSSSEIKCEGIDNAQLSKSLMSDEDSLNPVDNQQFQDVNQNFDSKPIFSGEHQPANFDSTNLSPIQACLQNMDASFINVQENNQSGKQVKNKINQDYDDEVQNCYELQSNTYNSSQIETQKDNILIKSQLESKNQQIKNSKYFQSNDDVNYQSSKKKRYNNSQTKSIQEFSTQKYENKKDKINYNDINQNPFTQKPSQKKGDGVRTHKMYDYVFIVMSQEHFNNEYATRKILLVNSKQANSDDQKQDQIKKNATSQSPKFKINQNQKNQQFIQSMLELNTKKQKLGSINQKQIEKNQKVFGVGQLLSPTNNNNININQQEPIDLNGIVQIRAYDSGLTDELPQVQCNLLASQLDHLKVLICEQIDKNHPKLFQDAYQRFQIEKQYQIQQYMQDIITKLKKKERRFKITTKRKYIDDALFNTTYTRKASVYVVIINREKIYDKDNSVQKFIELNNPNNDQNQSSSDEEFYIEQQMQIAKQEQIKNQRLKEGLKINSSYKYKNQNKVSMYDSDTNETGNQEMNTTFEINNQLSLKNFSKFLKNKKPVRALNSLIIKKNGGLKSRDDDAMVGYRFKYCEKEQFQRFGPTKIKVVQDINAHIHHQKHPINIFFYQYNEFIKLVIKNQKLQFQAQSSTIAPAYKFNHIYALGLAKQIGINLKRDAFSEQNMKSRDYVNQLKEKLIFCFWRKLNEHNKDLTPHNNPYYKDQIVNEKNGTNSLNQNEEIDGETQDSQSNMHNTPINKNIKQIKDNNVESAVNAQQIGNNINWPVTNYPPQNIIYKYFIGKGNNSIMVRNLFKNRFWWVQHEKEELEKCNFCWTQIKKPNIMDVLPCKFPHIKTGIKNINYNNTQNISQITQTPQSKSNKKKRNDSINSEKSQGQKQNNTQINIGNQNQSNINTEIIQKWNEFKLYNKIEDNFHLNNKKALFINMKNYYEAMEQDVFDNLPITFHIKNGLDDSEFQKFKQYYFKIEDEIKNKKLLKKKKENIEQKEKNQEQEISSNVNTPLQKSNLQINDEKENQYYHSPASLKNIWIIKPGENTNRGHGIQVAKEFEEIKSIILESTTNGRRTCIVQKYIHNPLLINRRKFDIRTYVLMTSINGNTKVYIYEEGYLRTSCREYSVNNLANKLVHLTNDAVQKKAEDYGKFEPGNKLSYIDFQAFLDKNYVDLNICFERDIKSQMNKLTTDIFRSVYTKLDPKRRLHCMEVFGLDFMIDDEFKPYLIEVNTNPCLELASPLLSRLIPTMLENALKISLDPIFLPPESFSLKKAFIGDPCPENRFELVFDSIIDGPVLEKLFKNKENMIVEMDEDELSEEEEHDDEE